MVSTHTVVLLLSMPQAVSCISLTRPVKEANQGFAVLCSEAQVLLDFNTRRHPTWSLASSMASRVLAVFPSTLSAYL